MKQYSKINIIKNLASIHSVMSADFLLNDESKPICYFQFISSQYDVEEHISENSSLEDSFAINVATNQTGFNVSVRIFNTNFNYLNT